MKNWLVILLIVLIGAAAYYYFQVYKPQHAELPPLPEISQTEPAFPEPAPEPEPNAAVDYEDMSTFTPEPVAEEEVMPLAESDPAVLESLTNLVGEAPVMQFVVAEDVISHVVATVDSLTSAQVPGIVLPVTGPGGEFEATADDRQNISITTLEGDPVRQFVLDPVNYQRYTAYVEMVEAMDVAGLLAMYDEYRPLFQQAWVEQGYPEGSFDTRLLEVMDHLLATPEVSDPIRLVKPEAFYLFADPDLEALSAGQKTLIRMGSDNARRIKAKLAEIRDALSA